MIRLTKIGISMAIDMLSHPSSCDESDIRMAVTDAIAGLKELQHYKDLEEQGRLIEQKHGRWYPMHFGGIWQCSECGYLTNDNKATKYCPDCGAKMDEVE